MAFNFYSKILSINCLKGEERGTRGSLKLLNIILCLYKIYLIGAGDDSINAISESIWIYSYKVKFSNPSL